jgi:hypothetical protein
MCTIHMECTMQAKATCFLWVYESLNIELSDFGEVNICRS